jgi:hypothetical protein
LEEDPAPDSPHDSPRYPSLDADADADAADAVDVSAADADSADAVAEAEAEVDADGADVDGTAVAEVEAEAEAEADADAEANVEVEADVDAAIEAEADAEADADTGADAPAAVSSMDDSLHIPALDASGPGTPVLEVQEEQESLPEVAAPQADAMQDDAPLEAPQGPQDDAASVMSMPSIDFAAAASFEPIPELSSMLLSLSDDDVTGQRLSR